MKEILLCIGKRETARERAFSMIVITPLLLLPLCDVGVHFTINDISSMHVTYLLNDHDVTKGEKCKLFQPKWKKMFKKRIDSSSGNPPHTYRKHGI